MTTMRAIVLDAPGPPDTFRHVEAALWSSGALSLPRKPWSLKPAPRVFQPSVTAVQDETWTCSVSKPLKPPKWS